jgi:hypothetical protein
MASMPTGTPSRPASEIQITTGRKAVKNGEQVPTSQKKSVNHFNQTQTRAQATLPF